MNRRINIAVIDDQNLFRQSLAVLINSVDTFNLAGEYQGGNDFISALEAIAENIDVAIVDLDMPDMNGIELNKYLQANYPAIKVVVLTGHANEMLITQMINSGAASYLLKNCEASELIYTIEAVNKNGFYFNAEVKHALKNTNLQRAVLTKSMNQLPAKLTRRELQVLELICKDRNNTEIADKLFLSVRTIEGHRNSLMNKIGCQTIAGLVMFALKHQLVDLSI
ncbi:response regulator transcription factor [Mucilaginibacter achroorhodeus]|uniref:Response regulator transcription factor n=1 Tax=Mucilaginibacter achroorhodeus TaxID=2599294 RepID=A0A563U0X1_9SPHI|nr:MULTISPECIES: response regulator transcription factor [Mucilaginibacter]QXV65390.1 response regulator transcription factor [Mucilaginibacter sp. 21P]TWR24501.1 response regulator transcription factor [Mucilaginibacter achroorhodeus]